MPTVPSVYVCEKDKEVVDRFDVKLYLRVINDADIINLQSALDTLSDWAATWQLSISVEKCCILNIGTITVAPFLSINHTPLPILSSNRDLGVTIAHDLSPSTNICGIVAKAQIEQMLFIAFVSFLVMSVYCYELTWSMLDHL